MELMVDHLSKRYGKTIWGLRDVSLRLEPGILGLVGPNGAGKSTLLRILATITQPSSGRVTWNGSDIRHAPNPLRAVLGYLPQDFGVYSNLNTVEFLEYIAAIKGLPARAERKRIGELLEFLNLFELRRQPLGSFSSGMNQRVGIAQALLNDPQLLILDEPTACLDPEERVRFRSLLTELGGERIIILSTHIISDVETAATESALIKSGQLLMRGAPEAILQSVVDKVWEWIAPSADLPLLHQKLLISTALARGEGVLLRAIPSLALALGMWRRSSKLFEVIYTLLWYMGPMSHFELLDYMGAGGNSRRS